MAYHVSNPADEYDVYPFSLDEYPSMNVLFQSAFGVEITKANFIKRFNTTPLGMFPNVDDAPALPYDHITPDHFLFDIVYNPAQTKFLREGEKMGAQISNGYQMLIEQAEESWRIWTGKV